MGSPSMYEAGLALNGLACFATPDISRDLANDVLTLVKKNCFTHFNVRFTCTRNTMSPLLTCGERIMSIIGSCMGV